MEAHSLLHSGETAVALFTEGKRFEINRDGTGTTGNWVVKAELDVDRVIIYRRRERTNEVYLADFAGISDAGERRRKIHFVNARMIDETDRSWTEFAGGGQNPVRYIAAEE